MTKIKICGVCRPCDIQYINEAKPDYAGFIIGIPKSHRNVTEEQLKDLKSLLLPEICPVGVFVDTPMDKIARMQNEGLIKVAQLHGAEEERDIRRLRQMTGGKPIWKAFKICSAADMEKAKGSSADLILLDRGYGTGQSFDWSLIGSINRPYILAGGITPENVADAIRFLHPYGLDVSSGVETEKKKDRAKILQIVRSVRNV